jgi:serine O-acetyltransferase
MTVVGIPGRIIRSAPEGRHGDGRVNLDHHAIPDPVGEILGMLIDRIAFLEARVSHLQGRPGAHLPPEAVRPARGTEAARPQDSPV